MSYTHHALAIHSSLVYTPTPLSIQDNIMAIYQSLSHSFTHHYSTPPIHTSSFLSCAYTTLLPSSTRFIFPLPPLPTQHTAPPTPTPTHTAHRSSHPHPYPHSTLLLPPPLLPTQHTAPPTPTPTHTAHRSSHSHSYPHSTPLLPLPLLPTQHTAPPTPTPLSLVLPLHAAYPKVVQDGQWCCWQVSRERV